MNPSKYFAKQSYFILPMIILTMIAGVLTCKSEEWKIENDADSNMGYILNAAGNYVPTPPRGIITIPYYEGKLWDVKFVDNDIKMAAGIAKLSPQGKVIEELGGYIFILYFSGNPISSDNQLNQLVKVGKLRMDKSGDLTIDNIPNNVVYIVVQVYRYQTNNKDETIGVWGDLAHEKTGICGKYPCFAEMHFQKR